MPRRLYTYRWLVVIKRNLYYWCIINGVGFLFLVVSIVYSHIKAPREATGDNWMVLDVL